MLLVLMGLGQMIVFPLASHNLFRDEVVKAMAKWRFEKNRPCQGVKRQFIFTPSRP